MSSLECLYTRAECHHNGYKCSECPITDLICDEFTNCLDLSYQQGRVDAKKEINEIMDMDVPISNILYEIDKWLKEQSK